jgi:mannose-6-phosphate isomerase
VSRPQTLPPNVLRHFYAGGDRIAAFRGLEARDDHSPEEWLGAVNTTFGATDGRGLSRTRDGALLRDLIAADPEAWLGPEHVARFGADPALLTKLLDAGERLPVHFHPGRALAREHLRLDHGKTEAWVILEAAPGASVHVGFTEDVAPHTVRRWLETQVSREMLGALHELPVAAGDTIFVPAGAPHAIGAGILMVELQEPTDLSIVLEWEPFPALSEADSHLGLGWDVALQALDRRGWSEEEANALRKSRYGLVPEARAYFRLEHVQGGDTLDAGYSVVVGLDGEGELGGEPIRRGSAVLVPHAAGRLELTGDARALRCRPPDPATPEGRW